MIEQQVGKCVTGIVATHEREEELAQMISSFRARYPLLQFVVADNSFDHYPRNDVDYIQLDPGSGISLSRNLALERVNSEYTLLLDDDLVRVDQTTLEDLLIHLRRFDYDIVAGQQREANGEEFEFHGKYERVGQLLVHYVGVDSGHFESDNPILTPKYDVTPNFFVAKTDVLKQLAGWDKELRFAKEHDDFFLRAKEAGLNVGYLPEVAALNNSITKHHGGNRGAACEQYFLEKWGCSDKIEVRWIQEPLPRLSFYSTLTKEVLQPSRQLFDRAVSVFLRKMTDFEVLDPDTGDLVSA